MNENDGKPDQQQGLYRKYNVERLNDPAGKHRECEYFILDLDHDPHAVAALEAYAASCKAQYPTLAFDLRHTAAASARKLGVPDTRAEVGDKDGCPCTVEGIEPCSSACTCASPFMSGGCRRCARYGSLEQRQSHARHIAETLSATRLPEPQLRPDLLPALPGQKALTFIMFPDRSAKEADAAIAAMKRGDTIFLPTPISELFFLQLRLRVALEPALADKIAVYYLTPEHKWQEAGLRFEDELRWPVGFMHEAWVKETETIAARSGDKASDGAKEMKAKLVAEYVNSSGKADG